MRSIQPHEYDELRPVRIQPDLPRLRRRLGPHRDGARPASSPPRPSRKKSRRSSRNTGSGWVTAEYAMLPRSTEKRTTRERTQGYPSGRSQEIQRLIGRTLRAVTDLKAHRRAADHPRLRRPPGGRRDAGRLDQRRLRRPGPGPEEDARPRNHRRHAPPPPRRRGERRASSAASPSSTSTTPRIPTAETDMNVVETDRGQLLEVQATAEKEPVLRRSLLERLLRLADQGIEEIIQVQKEVLKKKSLLFMAYGYGRRRAKESGDEPSPGHGRGGLPGQPSLRTPPRRGATTSSASTISSPATRTTSAPSRPSLLRAHPPRRHPSPLRRGRPDLSPGLPGLAHPLPAESDQDGQDQRHGHDQHARPGQADPGPDPARPRRPRSTATPRSTPRPEDYWGNVNPIGVRSCYDEGKRVAETLMMDYHRQNKVDIRIVRIFNTYGPRMAVDDGRVVSQFHRPGPPRRAAHDLRRRQPDALVLLCLRPDRRAVPDDGQPRTSSGRSTWGIPANSRSSSWPRRSSG